MKTANNKIPVSSAFNDSERLYGTTVCRCLVRRPHYSARLMRFGSRGPSEFSTEIRVSCFEGKTSKKLQILIPSKKPHFRYGKNYFSERAPEIGAPNENIVQNHLNIELLNVF